MVSRHFVLVILLSLLYTTSASHYRLVRQDTTDDSTTSADDSTLDDSTLSASASASDTSETGDASSSVDSSAQATSTTADTSATSTTTSSSATSSGILAGAGVGGAVPDSCISCQTNYKLINTCSSEGSSESCSPICTSWSAAVTCLNCLLLNGQVGLNQSAVQQIVWNLESSCEDLSISVSSATISATATTTGPFSTITVAATSSAASAKSSHSGLTIYNDTTRSSTVTASVIQMSYTVSNGQGKSRLISNGAVLAGAGMIGALMIARSSL